MCYLLDSGPLSVVVALRDNGSARGVGSVLGKAGGNWSGLIGFRGERPDLLIAAQRLMARNAAGVSLTRIRRRRQCSRPSTVSPQISLRIVVLRRLPLHHAARMNRAPEAAAPYAYRVSLQVPL